jgi:hypothetical protein
MSYTPPRPYRILRHYTLPVGTPIGIYYSTQDRRDARAQTWADRDGMSVLLEQWEDGDWWCIGEVKPAVSRVTLRIENHYEDETVTTEVKATIPIDDGTEDWSREHIFPHTGTEREDGPSTYDVEIVNSSVPELTGRTFEFG